MFRFHLKAWGGGQGWVRWGQEWMGWGTELGETGDSNQKRGEGYRVGAGLRDAKAVKVREGSACHSDAWIKSVVMGFAERVVCQGYMHERGCWCYVLCTAAT